jgi:hypothetical protein
VQILGLPTYPTPIFFLAIWSSLEETMEGEGSRGKVDSLFHPKWSSSLLAPKCGLAQKTPHIKSGKGVIYSPLLPWKDGGGVSLDLGVKEGPRFPCPRLEKCLAVEHRGCPPSQTSFLTWIGQGHLQNLGVEEEIWKIQRHGSQGRHGILM